MGMSLLFLKKTVFAFFLKKIFLFKKIFFTEIMHEIAVCEMDTRRPVNKKTDAFEIFCKK